MKADLPQIMVEEFLQKVDPLFPVPISKKQDLGEYAYKLVTYADVFAEIVQEQMVSLAAGYINNSRDDLAYISLVATLPEFQGRGMARTLVTEFVNEARKEHKRMIHLYAVASNRPAVSMYKKLGFEEWKIPNEPRKQDLHLRLILSNDCK